MKKYLLLLVLLQAVPAGAVTIETINSSATGETWGVSRTKINSNFVNLNNGKVEGTNTLYVSGTEPTSCDNGDLWVNTAGTSGQQLYACESAAWVLQGDGGGDAAVTSVNGAIGVVVLDADDIDDTSTTNKWVTQALIDSWTAKQDALVADTDYLTPGTATSTYEPVKGSDDNYVTDAQLVVIGNTSGTNTGDQNSGTVTVDTTNFDGNLSIADNTVLKALETIDDLAIGTGTDNVESGDTDGQIPVWDQTTTQKYQPVTPTDVTVADPLVLNSNTLGYSLNPSTLSSTQTLATGACEGHHYFVNGAYTITLPATGDSSFCCFQAIGANVVTIDPNASDLVVLNGTALTDGTAIVSGGEAGESVCVSYYSADGWATWGGQTWSSE